MNGDRLYFGEALEQALVPWNLFLTTSQRDLLAEHYLAMIEHNQKVNLTRITDPVEAAVKHYADSLSVLLWIDRMRIAPRSLLDIGTGAGFPAIPLAVARPEWEVVALDATGKKTAFLVECLLKLRLDNLRIEHAHSAHWKTRHRFDIVTLKAVGSLRECLEQGARFLAGKGHVVVFKTGAIAAEEVAEAWEFARGNGLKLGEPFDYALGCRGEMFKRRLYSANAATGRRLGAR